MNVTHRDRDTAAPAPRTPGATLPKLEVPTFVRDILKWKSFWDQFSVSIHDRNDLTNAEKMVYFQNALKDHAAKCTIEGLTKSGEHYEEAVECLKTRYNRPRLVHQTHVGRIVDAPSLKDRTGKELRALHDTVVQHLRALKALGDEPSVQFKQFITSLIERKLDPTTMFEDVPDCGELLSFIDLRATAAEATVSEKKPPKGNHPPSHKSKHVSAHAVSAKEAPSSCVCCEGEKHPLYSCTKFRSMSHDEMVSLSKKHGHCLNCLRPNHFVKDCKSVNHCKVCQNPHHTLLHVDKPKEPPPNPSNHASITIQSNLLLMTCQVLVKCPQGTIQVRALLDSGSAMSFVSERVAQSLHLARSSQKIQICGVTGAPLEDSHHSLSSFKVAPLHNPKQQLAVNAVIVPRVTCDLPTKPVPLNQEWKHINGLKLADPDFGKPGKIDLLLGMETFGDIIRQGRRRGRRGSPMAYETCFGWVLGGSTNIAGANPLPSHHTSILTGDDLLRQFWEMEEKPMAHSTLTPDERAVLNHFDAHHSRDSEGRFMVPLPKKPTSMELGESRTQAVRRFLSFERMMYSKGQFEEVEKVIDEYFENKHAEPVPQADLKKSPNKVFYLPMHVVRKESSTTTKV